MFSLSLSLHQWRIQNKRLGGQSNTVHQNIVRFFKYPRLSATIVGYHTKVVTGYLV